mmetsp:Transcript_23473/g.56166  ORF Transcript_23473/g.56166 Transcript_23473/m.56166 type:complete len:125 (-) Transcript_23473:240-614(-)
MVLSDELFDSVVSAFFENDDFAAAFEEFAKKNCDIFTSEEEHKLEYTEVYNKFQELFEQKLSGLLQEKGTTTEEFYASCKEAVQKGNSDREEFLRLILALTDYEMFISVMRDEKARKDSDTSMV